MPSPLVTAAARAIAVELFGEQQADFDITDDEMAAAEVVVGVVLDARADERAEVLDAVTAHIRASVGRVDRSSPHIRIGYVMATRDVLAILAKLRKDVNAKDE